VIAERVKMNKIDNYNTLEYTKAEPAKFVASPLQRLYINLQFIVGIVTLFAYDIFLKVLDVIRGVKTEPVRGQVCLVTGGANGLGREIAKRFAKEGCTIAIADVVDSESAVNEIVETFGVKCCGYKCDVSDKNSIENLKTQVEAEMGKVSILVNNAGLLFFGSVFENSIENIKKCIEVNLFSHFLVSFTLFDVS
jgi:all-trans-retinol dehydrogenase (NAD+)